ncbi:hypothetical protein GN156_02720 [bacterium LRH843]|nr:hypothetical protein [bacterium LRH843]
MAEQEKFQSDFFDELMFGKRDVDMQEKHPEKENERQENSLASSEYEDQLKQLLTLVQSIAPTLEKLTPFMRIFSTFLTKQEKNSTTNQQSNKANADE